MIRKTNISYFEDILEYLKKHFPSCINDILNIPIVMVPSDLWTKFNFVGYGYVVRKEELMVNSRYLEMYSSNQKLYESLPTKEHKRDINIYRILKNLSFPNIFILVLEDSNSKFFILHELSHICGVDESFSYELRFGDEYLDAKEEQSAYFTEIRYAKQSEITFEEYFRSAHPTEYKVLSEGKTAKNRELYELAEIDRRDYKKMWDNVKE